MLTTKKIIAAFGIVCLKVLLASEPVQAADFPGYRSELNIIYSTPAGQDLKFNAFLPVADTNPAPAMVDIHGGWLFGGEAASRVDGVGGWQFFTRRGIAVFSIQYRLG